MAIVEYKPVQKIVLYEILHYELDHFIEQVIKFTQGSPVLKWCNGVLFTSEMMPYTPDIISDRLEGILHWNYIEFAYMDKFQATVLSRDGRPVTVVDVSTNTAIIDVTRWLKKQSQWKVLET